MKEPGIKFVQFDDENLSHCQDYRSFDTDWVDELEILENETIRKIQPRRYTRKKKSAAKRF